MVNSEKCNNSVEILLNKGRKILENSQYYRTEYNNSILDAQLLMMKVLQKEKIYLYSHKEELVSEDEANRFTELINERAKGYPIQYLTKVQQFMDLELYVEDGVLVPRADTEILVEKIIELAQTLLPKDKTIKILDIGTGSGAIAVSLAYYIKSSQITAIDVSDIALRVSQINAEKLNLSNVAIEKADIFDENFVINEGNRKYHIIVSNPPYIEKDQIDKLQVEVSKYEPRLALDGGEDGLDYYRRICKISEEIIETGGMLAFEIGYNQGEEVVEMLSKLKNCKSTELVKDLSGKDRVVVGVFK